MEKLEFKEFRKTTQPQDKSSVWYFFLRTTDGTHAKCKQCDKILKCQNTTTCLHNHLKIHRRVREENEPSTNSTESAMSAPQKRGIQSQSRDKNELLNKKSRIGDYFLTSEDDMEIMVSKMTACDGLPFSIFCTSDSIRRLFLKSGCKNLPKSPNTIKKIVVAKSDEIKRDLKRELTTMKAEGKKFSVTLDEWTSDSNRRYMNVNIHNHTFKDKTFRNLGLARIKGRATAERCVNILRDKLAIFDLNLEKDIACAVTDGASVMCSLGRKVPTYHQQCFAHGIQCAVIDAIYKRNVNDSEERDDWANETTVNNDETDSEYGDSDAEEENGGFIVQQRNQNRILSLTDYKDIIDKVRKVVKFFKKSPLRSEVLNNYTREENKNLQLILDCKTRWNSLANMVERFLVLKEPVMKALIDLKNEITLNPSEFRILEDFSTSLNMVKTTVEALCQENANLLTAEAALQFMISKLQLQAENSIISRRLLKALSERITQRRQEELVCALKYLHNPFKYYKELPSAIFTLAGNDAITRLIVDINKRYFDCNRQNTDYNEDHIDDDTPLINIRSQLPTNIEDTQTQVTQGSQETEEIEKGLSLKEQLQKTIHATMFATASTSSTTVNLTNDDEFETSIRMEMALFDRGGPRQLHLSIFLNEIHK